MDEKQQIEEMAKDINYAIRKECKLNTVGHCNDCEFNVAENTNEIDCQSYLVSKVLTQMNYRIIPEGAIVLTREEQDKILKATENRIEQLKEENGQLRLENNDLEAENDKLKNFNDKLSQGIYYGNGEQFCNRLYQARKETAREILKKLYTVLWNEKITIANTFVNLDVEIREIAKQYGVEVEE